MTIVEEEEEEEEEEGEEEEEEEVGELERAGGPLMFANYEGGELNLI